MKVKYFNKKIIYIVIVVIFAFFSTIYLTKYWLDILKSKKEKIILAKFMAPEENIVLDEDHPVTQEETPLEPEQVKKTEKMEKLETLQKQNDDIVAWIEIKDTNIHYPVVQGSDNDYYLDHNYKKKYSVHGAIFLDKDYSWNPPNSNLLIYGHHTTFQDLLKYQKKSFYLKHPTIQFTTNTEDANYEIIAVFKSKVYYQTDQNVFRYYYFLNATNEKEYDEYVKSAKKASLYDTGKSAQYGDQLITLSTCSYHTKDGRFVVVARRSENILN